MASLSISTLSADIANGVTVYLQGVLEDIAKVYKLDANELKEKYLDVTSPAATDNTEKKKRGRKKKVKDEFIETYEHEYEGEKYLVDNNNNVYTYNVDEPMLIGEMLVDGTIKTYAHANSS